jgi:hypothetical protein
MFGKIPAYAVNAVHRKALNASGNGQAGLEVRFEGESGHGVIPENASLAEKRKIGFSVAD